MEVTPGLHSVEHVSQDAQMAVLAIYAMDLQAIGLTVIGSTLKMVDTYARAYWQN